MFTMNDYKMLHRALSSWHGETHRDDRRAQVALVHRLSLLIVGNGLLPYATEEPKGPPPPANTVRDATIKRIYPLARVAILNIFRSQPNEWADITTAFVAVFAAAIDIIGESPNASIDPSLFAKAAVRALVRLPGLDPAVKNALEAVNLAGIVTGPGGDA